MNFEFCIACDRVTPLYVDETAFNIHWYCIVCDKLIDSEVKYDGFPDELDGLDDLFNY